MANVKWGESKKGVELMPYSSLAVRNHQFEMGQTIYIKQMDGLRLPGTFGQIHNGCVRVDDVCERCEVTQAEYHFDLFVGTAAYSKKMDIEMKATDRMITF